MQMDETFMHMALDLAERGRGQTAPNPLVGAVVVKDGYIVGQGAHLRAGTPHAEVHAIEMAGDQAQGATIYVTLEPCRHFGRTPPCTQKIISSGITRVVTAALDVDPRTAGLGVRELRDAGIEVVTGVLETEAKKQNQSFFHRMSTGRPWIVYKSAMTLSGHVAANSGHSQYVTGDTARQDVQRLRHAHEAILVGIGTVLADNPRLTVRDEVGEHHSRQPTRIIFDSKLRIPLQAQLLSMPGETWICTTAAMRNVALSKVEALEKMAGVHVLGVEQGCDVGAHVAIDEALTKLADRGLNSVLLEGGPTLAGSFLAAQRIDEVHVYIAPSLLTNGLPPLSGPRTTAMTEQVRLTDVEWVQVGEDVRVTGRPVWTMQRAREST